MKMSNSKMRNLKEIALTSSLFLDKIVSPPTGLQISNLTHSAYKKASKICHEQHKNQTWFQKFLIWLYPTWFVACCTRSLLMGVVFTDNQYYLTTVFGSVFQMINVDRFSIEVCVFFISSYALLNHLSIFITTKRLLYFKLILVYCHQVFNPRYSRKTVENVFEFPTDLESKLKIHLYRNYLYGGFSHYLFAIEATFVTSCIYIFGNVEPVNTDFYPDISVFYVNGAVMVVKWILWAFCSCIFMMNVFVIFFNSTEIIQMKIRHLMIQLKLLKKFQLKHVPLLRRLLTKNVQLFDEILQMSEFWKAYLSITNVLFSLWTCFLFYIVLVTKTFIMMKLAMIAAIVVPAGILYQTTMSSSRIYLSGMQLYKIYSITLAHNQQHIPIKQKIKVFLNKKKVISKNLVY